ncbi:sulfate/molybdate ABC transporter ATP-binding protein [Microbacterium sp. CH12i]|uniref:sulfate/molybdate ABC transporter ATP-binding protein n=1 Tax=Microbacterium sp. CH12i TaxID=1479651 RepID=UPI00068C2868|nr:ATP-binding cassette domain-containing protein [Microbacterium sp. CH12i]
MTLDIDIRTRVGNFTLEAALTAHSGEVLAVLGPNGSGKSTLLGTIAGHLPASGGRIELAGRLLESVPSSGSGGHVWVPPERRRVALLGQRAMLLPHLTALENVAFGPRAQGVPRTTARSTAAAWLGEVGMGEYAQRRPAQLSGGQQQRVALARALAAEPEALLLDEPFTSLDAQTAAQARRLITEQRDRTGVPMVLVTHDPMDAVVLAARTVVLRDGRIVQQGTTAEVLGHPGSQFVAAMAGVNLIAGITDARGCCGPPMGPA